MQSTILTLKKILTETIHHTFSEHDISDDLIDVTLSTNEKFGHYQCNSAMKLSGLLKLPPRDIATRWVTELDQVKHPMIDLVEVAGPGFINITLKVNYLADRAVMRLNDSHLGIEQVGQRKKCVIDYSSPNTAKEMHVGHLRSSIIGDSLANLFELLGYDVLRLNHIGDWGTAFGMLIAYLKQYHPDIVSGQTETDLTHLVSWYKASKVLFDEDPQFKKQSQLEVVALQGGDETALKAWERICEISRNAYQIIYDLLGINLIDRGESFYNPLLKNLVTDLESKGLIVESDGAKCIFIPGYQNREGEPLPLMIQKSDGGYNYAATDMAAIRHRIQDEKANQIIYVIDSGQSLHMQMIFKAAELAGYLDPNKVRVDHVGFGLVLGQDGKKFKTRSGDTIRLQDLLEAAIDKAKSILLERNVEMSDGEIQQTARVLGINAVKYADLSTNRIHDYTFSFDKMLQFEGNTAAFLMYSYVRIQAIKRKVGHDVDINQAIIHLSHPSEIALAHHLDQFSDVLLQVSRDYSPHRLADYLYQLANSFNAFFRDCRVEGDVNQASRLALIELVSRVLKTGLSILGLKVIDKM